MDELFDDDFSEDFLRCDKTLDIDQKQYDDVQKAIIESNDCAMAYFFAKKFFYKSYLMQKVILDNKSPKYSYLFAKDIQGSDIKALQKIVLLSNKIKYICKFACFIENSPKLKSSIIKSKNIKYALMYLKHVDSDISILKDLIFKSNKPRYLFELAKCSYDPIIEDLIIKTGSFTYIRMFASKIKNANIEKLESFVLSTNNMKEIKKFAKSVKKSKLSNFI